MVLNEKYSFAYETRLNYPTKLSANIRPLEEHELRICSMSSNLSNCGRPVKQSILGIENLGGGEGGDNPSCSIMRSSKEIFLEVSVKILVNVSVPHRILCCSLCR